MLLGTGRGMAEDTVLSRASGPVSEITAVLREGVVVYEPKETEFQAPKHLVFMRRIALSRIPNFKKNGFGIHEPQNRGDHPEMLLL